MADPKLLPPAHERTLPELDPVQFIEDHPLVCLGIAAGIGYVVGGGLFTPFTARVIKTGARALVLPSLKGKLKGLTEE